MSAARAAARALPVALLALAAAPVHAQPAVSSFAELSRTLRGGNLVLVTDTAGGRVKGKIRELTDATVTVVTSGALQHERRLAADEIARISQIDSRLNGFLIGFAAGAVPGTMLGVGFNQYCKNESPDYCPQAIVFFSGGLGLLGGWIGYAIDNAINGETLRFVRPRGAASHLRVAPAVTRHSFGLAVDLSF